jgi:hypothetical protein
MGGRASQTWQHCNEKKSHCSIPTQKFSGGMNANGAEVNKNPAQLGLLLRSMSMFQFMITLLLCLLVLVGVSICHCHHHNKESIFVVDLWLVTGKD